MAHKKSRRVENNSGCTSENKPLQQEAQIDIMNSTSTITMIQVCQLFGEMANKTKEKLN